MLRPFFEDPLALKFSPYLVELPILVFFVIFVVSYKGYVFFYTCVCNSLSNGFKEWNKKAQDIFDGKKNANFYYSKHEASPCSLDHLVDSHFVLLKLVNEANENLGILVGSYFATQIVIICFETYFLVDMGLNGGWMTVCALIILLQTSVILIMVALSASSVHEEVIIPFLIAFACFNNWICRL